MHYIRLERSTARKSVLQQTVALKASDHGSAAKIKLLLVATVIVLVAALMIPVAVAFCHIYSDGI